MNYLTRLNRKVLIMNIQREMTISTLEEMCDLMCGGVEMHEIYDEKEDE